MMDDKVNRTHAMVISASLAAGIFAAFGYWAPMATWAAVGIIGSLYDIARAIMYRK